MSNVKFKYFGDTSKAYTNVLTIASELLYDKESNKYLIRFGYSFSNIKDRYDKRIGKDLALDRLCKYPCNVIITDGVIKPTYKQIDESILEYIVEEIDNIPSWFYKWYMKPNNNKLYK